MPGLARRRFLLTSLALLAVWSAAGVAHFPHTSSETTVALEATHAEQSPHFETSELAHTAPCSTCLLQRQAPRVGGTGEQPRPLPAAGRRAPGVDAPELARLVSPQGARAPPLA